jgi:mannose-6-phosphate isomerase-like protein (cupin superfamily)
MTAQIAVVPRAAIPVIHSIEQAGARHELGELRDFRWHKLLEDFMPPSSRLSVSWVALKSGEVLAPHVHPIQSLMIFYAGSGQLIGQNRRAVGAGDIVVVPAGCEHGFIGGAGGLRGLSIQFGEGLYTTPDQPRVAFSDDGDSAAKLLEYNRTRIAQFARLPVFDLLGDGTLDDATRRKRYLDHLQIWVNGNQRLLFCRQASCRDPRFEPVFLKHLQEELGHDVLHAERQDATRPEPATRDPILEAITDWFVYQMHILDNLEKTAIIHLVIENASVTYHRRAMPALAKYVNNKYFEVHVEADAEHAAMGERLIANQLPATYRRLREVIGRAWDMIGAMTDRLVAVTLQEPGAEVSP